MKRIIATSLCLISFASIAQTTPSAPKTDMVKDIIQTQAPQTCPANCQQDTPKPIKKRVIKKKKPVIKPVEQIMIKKEEQNVILGLDVFHIPKETTNRDELIWAKPLTYADIDVQFSHIKSENNAKFFYNQYNQTNDSFSVQLINKKTNEKLDSNSLTNLPVVNADISLVTVSTNLKNISQNKIKYSDPSIPLVFNTLQKTNICSAFIVSYQLKNEPEQFNKVKFIDKNNNVSDTIPDTCLTQDSQYNRESTFYTNNGNIINFGINNSKMTQDKKISFVLHTSKNGKEFFGGELESFAFNRTMQNVIFLKPQADKRGPFFGTNLETIKEAPSDDYNILTKFISENNEEILQFKTSIR